ncbi:MAG TPA: ferrochelatase [Candidatus Dormibacteraeota bacterium]|nr:ferrochelatase [Candidatus Dormibacteraeota bacterium]
MPAIILMAYGSPSSLDEVGDYLAQVRGGRGSSPDEIEHLKQRYQRVGGQTPLLQITKSQADVLQKKLIADGAPARVSFGMKHWHPFVEDVVEKISIDNPPILVGLALAPHYSKLSIGGYEDSVRRGLARKHSKVPFVMVKSWHTEPSLITALSTRVGNMLKEIAGSGGTMVVFTAHSLPLRVVSDDDPYRAQLLETSQLVAREAGVTEWDFAFQSASGPTGTWLGPSLKEKISEFSDKGIKRILVCPVGFVSDHLEILYDLDVEARDYANSHGIALTRTLSLNDDPMFIEALAEVAKPILVRQIAAR